MPDETPTGMEQITAYRCALCGSELLDGVRIIQASRGRATRCEGCERHVERAARWNEQHYKVPERYAKIAAPPELDPTKSYLLSGPPGCGKTYRGYSLLLFAAIDPRRRLAAYSWPKVLLELRRGYSMRQGEERPGDAMVEALRLADVALIDDLGAEKVSETNLDWLQEYLFVILDDRWAHCRQTILTTNLSVDGLRDYFGERVASRLAGMCEVKAMERAPDFRRRMAAQGKES